MSLALARKYRPISFDGLIGQEAVSETLSLALDRNRLSHAYLFSGLRGSGKTSTARIFAKALLCEKGTTSHPCEVCPHCLMANSSRHLDIIEMDAASNRKIDDIRDLIEHTKYKPSSARYKIFIIDEVHMLTKEAFNALLKTLEEPPDFVKFILATTDPLKLPATILSRTQHFRFRKIAQSVLVQHLAHILELEGVAYESNALEIIARSGVGSVRDALTLLDQAIVYSKNFIDVTTVTNMLGIIEPSRLEGLLNSIFQKDEAQVLAFIKEASSFESEMVIDELMLYLKEALLSGSKEIEPMIIERFFRVLAESKILFNMGSDGEFVLSLTLFKMINRLEDCQKVEILTIPESIGNEKVQKELQKEALIVPKEKISLEAVKKIEKPADKGLMLFEALVVKVYDRNYELGEAFKQSITYSSFKPNILTWESSAHGDAKTMLRNNWGVIRLFVQEVFGLETTIKNIPKKILNEDVPKRETLQSKSLEVILNREVEAPMKSSCVAPDHGGVESAKEKDEETILNEPMVVKALELFTPKKVRIKRKG